MKLHLPKRLLTAVLAVVMLQHALAGWDTKKNENYYVGKEDASVSLNTASSSQTGTSSYYILAGDNGIEYTFTSISSATDTSVTFGNSNAYWDDNLRRAFKLLTVEELNFGDGSGKGSIVVEKYTKDDIEYSNTVVINKVSGTLSTVTNAGTLTIGAAGNTTTFGGSITNTGTVTLGGNIVVKNIENGGFRVLEAGGTSYSAGANGYRTDTGAWLYLVQGGTVVKNNISTITVNNTTLTADKIREVDSGGLAFSAGDITSTDYHVNTQVTYGAGTEADSAPGFLLNDGSTLIVDKELDTAVVPGGIIGAANASSTLNLTANGVVANNSISKQSGATITATGSGTIQMAEGGTYTNASQLNTTLGADWTGTVEFKNATAVNFNFGEYGNANSTIKVNGLSGWYNRPFNIQSILELEGDGLIIDDCSESNNFISKKIIGSGDLKLCSGMDSAFIFTLQIGADTSEWTGTLNLADHVSDKNICRYDVKFTGGNQIFAEGGAITSSRSATGVNGMTVGDVNISIGNAEHTSYLNATVTNSGSGVMNVNVTHDTVFNKAMTNVTALDVSAGATATIKENSSVGTVTVADNGALKLDESNATHRVGTLSAEGKVQVVEHNTLELTGTTHSIADLHGKGTIKTTGASPSTLNVTKGEFAGTLTQADNAGALAVVKNGDGTLELYGANTYTGGTTINGGTLTAANADALGTGKVTMNGGTLQQNAALTVSNMDYNSGTVNNNGHNLTVEGTLKVNAPAVSTYSSTSAPLMAIAGSGTTEIDTLALGAGLNADSYAFTTEGSLTLGTLALDLSGYTAGEYKLVSSTGTLTWTEGSYTTTNLGSGLLANVSMADNCLSLTISPESTEPTTTTLNITSVGTYDSATEMLTLNVDKEVSDSGMYIIPGIADDFMQAILKATAGDADGMVCITLQGLNNTSVVAGINKNVGFLGKDGTSVYYGQTVGDGAEAKQMYQAQYIPEPATATLSLLALAGLAARRRRK